jgi:prolyl oligopeptidase
MLLCRRLAIAACPFLILHTLFGQVLRVPVTPKRPVVDVYHGTRVADPYRWLQASDSEEVRAWGATQNARSRAYFDSLPNRNEIASSLNAMFGNKAPYFWEIQRAGGRWFALANKPPRPPAIVSFASPDNPGYDIVLDPLTLDPRGGVSILSFQPSPDGKLIAVCLSENGSENGVMRVFKTSGEALPERVPNVSYSTAQASIAWTADSRGFYYTRFLTPQEKPGAQMGFHQQIYFHKLGVDPAEDKHEAGEDFPRIAEAKLQTSPDGQYVLASVANGDGGEMFHVIRQPNGKWVRIARLADRASIAKFGPDGNLYVLSRLESLMGSVVRLSPPYFALDKAKVIAPAGRWSVANFVPTKTRLYVHYRAGGPSELRYFCLAGCTAEKHVDIKLLSSVEMEMWAGGDDLLFQNVTDLEPPAYYVVSGTTGEVRPTPMRLESAVRFNDVEVLRIYAISKDGTQVPMNILRRRGTKLDGNNPVLMVGYGGYGHSLSPAFAVRRRFWLDAGGVFVYANVRGGGEFGEKWHEQGMLKNKQNAIDDLIACAEHLIKIKYTSPARLAIEGSSNGGLLVAAAMTQRPDLFRAVLAHYGMYDMLRAEFFPNGEFNTTEFGTVKEKDQFEALLAYSPYQRVRDGIVYPAVLITAGENDQVVDVSHSRKFVARLQEANAGWRPILLRTLPAGGHGKAVSYNERVEREADIFAFLFDQLEMKWSPPKPEDKVSAD